MSWRELRVVVPAGLVDRASAALFAAGAAGLQEDYLPGQAPPPRQPWDTGAPPPEPREREIVGWFQDPDPAAVLAALPPQARDPRWSDVPDEDWEHSWQQGFEPIAISPALTISPPWCAPPGALLIEPGQGFGTGLHPSTQAALRLMEPVLPGLNSCLDVGCGSGILALLAARHGLRAYGIDVEDSAIVEARRHAELNELAATFDTTPLAQVPGRWDLVAANLHAELLDALAPALIARTERWLICAGILADRESIARRSLDPHFVLDAREVDGDWVALRYRRAPA